MSTLYVDNLEPNLSSQVEIPNLKPAAGSVVQTLQAYTSPSGSNRTSFGISSGQGPALGSNYGGRTYNTAETLTITKKNPDSYFVCWGMACFTNYTSVATMAHGVVIVLDGTSMINCGDYPYYDEASFANVDTFYKPPMSVSGVLETASGLTTHTITLRPFGYIEVGSATVTYNGTSLIIQEIAQ